MKLKFDRSHYLSNPDVFEAKGLEEVDHELCEFNDHIDDIAYELAYTRYALAKAEAKLHNIEEGLNRLESFLMDGMARSIEPVNVDGEPMFALCAGVHITKTRAPTLSLLIDKILTGGK